MNFLFSFCCFLFKRKKLNCSIATVLTNTFNMHIGIIFILENNEIKNIIIMIMTLKI